MDIRVSILRLRKVLERTGFSRSTLYLRIAAGSFPRPISLGGRSVGWVDSEVDAWIASRVAESRLGSK
ncbi:MAG: alpA [Edaphobacter sp.]|nr:alpA [Edaphobacter sp.]